MSDTTSARDPREDRKRDIPTKGHRVNNLPEVNRVRRGHPFYPTGAEELPALYKTERTPAADKVVRAHWFIGAMDWWAVEYDPAEGIAFGYINLGDSQNAEWGYFSLVELEAITAGTGGVWVVERDLNWEPTPFAQVRTVR